MLTFDAAATVSHKPGATRTDLSELKPTEWMQVVDLVLGVVYLLGRDRGLGVKTLRNFFFLFSVSNIFVRHNL